MTYKATTSTKKRLYESGHGYGELLLFYLPLAGASLIQGLRGPLLDAGMTRGNFPIESLAAFAVISSVMMMLATSANALQSLFLVFVRGRQSFQQIQKFSIWYGGIVLAVGAFLIVPPISGFLFMHLMGVTVKINNFVTPGIRIMLFYPLIMIVRAFFQSLLVLNGKTRSIWTASSIGLLILLVISFGISPLVPLRASTMAAMAQVAVACIETVLLWFMARRTVRDSMEDDERTDEPPATIGRILKFLWPLLLTQMVMSGTTPLVSAGLLRLDEGELALAGFRVAWSLSVVGFGAIMMLRQTMLVMSRNPADHKRGRLFSLLVGAITTTLLILMSVGPIGTFILDTVIGSPPQVSDVALPAWRILAFLPFLASLRQFYTSILLHHRKTREAGVGSLLRVIVVAVFLFYFAPGIALAGAILGALARLGGGVIESIAATAIAHRYYEKSPLSSDGRS